jgi:hypothetical protein
MIGKYTVKSDVNINNGPMRSTVPNPLQREAERRWAESDKIAAKRQKRARVKTQARAKRREKADAQAAEIENLKKKLALANQLLAQSRNRHKR